MESAKLNSFFFVGKDPPENPHIGDIWCSGGIGNSMMVWTEDGAVEIGNVSSSLDLAANVNIVVYNIERFHIKINK